MANNSMDVLYDYFFHYNPYTETWNAVKREDVSKYMNGDLKTKILKGDTVHDLQKYIIQQDQRKGKCKTSDRTQEILQYFAKD